MGGEEEVGILIGIIYKVIKKKKRKRVSLTCILALEKSLRLCICTLTLTEFSSLFLGLMMLLREAGAKSD